jgi:uncharacterized protein (DUF1810 family)
MNMPTPEFMVQAKDFQLERFVQAQDRVYADVLDELRQGNKTSHWMWFVFPQHRELGRSTLARHYGIRTLQEARTYLAHPVLGPRLLQCCQLLLTHTGKTALDILHRPDDLKLCSSMTLFAMAAPYEPIFQKVLNQFYGGESDVMTVQLVRRNYE